MTIATTVSPKLNELIQINWIKSKYELDNYIKKTTVFETITVHDSFIIDEFVNHGMSFMDYVTMIKLIRPNIVLDFKYKSNLDIESLSNMVKNIKTPRDMAMHILRESTMLDTLRGCSKTFKRLQSDNIRKDSNISALNAVLKDKEKELSELRSNYANSEANFIDISGRLKSINELNYTLNVDHFNVVFFIKLNEECKHTYSLISAIRNKLSTMNYTSSVLALLPLGSNLGFNKWISRGFIDIREPYIDKLVDCDRAVTDLYHKESMETFLTNTRQSQVLIIYDKTLSTFMPFNGHNFVFMDIGRNFLKNAIHYGDIPDIDTVSMTYIDLMNLYTDNEPIRALFSTLGQQY